MQNFDFLLALLESRKKNSHSYKSTHASSGYGGRGVRDDVADDGGARERDHGEVQVVDLRDQLGPGIGFPAPGSRRRELAQHPHDADQDAQDEAPERALSIFSKIKENNKI